MMEDEGFLDGACAMVITKSFTKTLMKRVHVELGAFWSNLSNDSYALIIAKRWDGWSPCVYSAPRHKPTITGDAPFQKSPKMTTNCREIRLKLIKKERVLKKNLGVFCILPPCRHSEIPSIQNFQFLKCYCSCNFNF